MVALAAAEAREERAQVSDAESDDFIGGGWLGHGSPFLVGRAGKARGLTDGGDVGPEQVKWDVDLEPNLPRHGWLRTATAQIHRFLVEGTVTLQTLSFRGNVVPTERFVERPAERSNRSKPQRTENHRREQLPTRAESKSPSKNAQNPNEMCEPPKHVPNPSGKHISVEKRPKPERDG